MTSEMEMELFKTDEFYVLMNSKSSLWCNRRTGEIQAKPGWELANSGDPECLGLFYGLVGKIDFHIDGEARLLLIKDIDTVGPLPDGRQVVKIRSIAFLHICGPDTSSTDLGLKTCRKHTGGFHFSNPFDSPSSNKSSVGLAKTWGTIKSATSSIKSTTQQAAAMATYQVKSGLKKDAKDREKFEKRILDELNRVFTETDSFYFCIGPHGGSDCDLTNCLQKNSYSGVVIDDRFFWNKFMLKDILEVNDDLAKAWVLPIIQGFVQIEQCTIEADPTYFGSSQSQVVTLGLISRRSRYRAGTRYKRRGLDEDGKCANYVETEQFVATDSHHVSFVQVRGSVPLFWSQPGYKYRPPPHIDKGEVETRLAFEKHMKEELSIYGPVCIVNLVEQTGKEKVIWDGFTQQVMQYNNDSVTYTTFDFHEHCRGMKFENVSYLMERLEDVIQEMGFCWKDAQGVICSQKSVFRVNCIDCLDRTNVVQTAIGKTVLEIQLTKLGLLPPEGNLPNSIRTTFQILWANNGDIISKQYAGTNALKGDYTRTGERKLTGMMKDGMNSANRYLRRVLLDDLRQSSLELCLEGRYTPPSLTSLVAHDFIDVMSVPVYSNPLLLERELLLGVAVINLSRYYLSRFKDVYRQAAVDLMQGQLVTEEMLSAVDDADSTATAEHVKLLIEDCKKLLISDSSLIVGAWGLINADPNTGDPTETDMDTILILTRTSYYVADYDDEIDLITKCQRVLLDDLTMVELGPWEAQFSSNPLNLFNKKAKSGSQYCLRFRYSVDDQPGFSHTFRSSNLRFFNNVAIVIKNEEEMIESLRAICDCIRVALEIAQAGNDVEWHMDVPLNKIGTPSTPNSLGAPQIPRNTSETQLTNLKNVGTKAITNMTSRFTKIGDSIRRKSAANPEVSISEFQGSRHDEDFVSPFKQMSPSSVAESKQNETFLPNVGIVMSNTCFAQEDVLDADDVLVSADDDTGTSRPSSLAVNKPSELKVRTFSHSSSEVDEKELLKPEQRSESSSAKLELTLGSITSSQSENALRSIKTGFSTATNVLTSPSAAAVLSPLTKLAKGMQSLGANLDIRRLKQVKQANYRPTAETIRLREVWTASGCKSKLIAV